MCRRSGKEAAGEVAEAEVREVTGPEPVGALCPLLKVGQELGPSEQMRDGT